MIRHAMTVVLATAILLLGPALPVRAQTTAKDVSQKASETADAMRSYTLEKKDEAVAQARKLAADLDAKIRDLEAQASQQTGEAKAKSQDQLRDLKAKRAEAGRKLDDLTRASKASWERAKEGFANAYRDLAESYEKAAAEFKK
jgi:hypothetical protein